MNSKEMIAVAVVDLKTGPALDWAVAKAVGIPCVLTASMVVCEIVGSDDEDTASYHPSTDWAQGGPLIDRFGVTFHGSSKPIGNGEWHTKLCATVAKSCTIDGSPAYGWHDNYYEHLPAAMRAIVSAKFGDAVSVPKVLAEVRS